MSKSGLFCPPVLVTLTVRKWHVPKVPIGADHSMIRDARETTEGLSSALIIV